MKTTSILSAILTLLIATANIQAQAPSGSKKILVVYYSLSGNTQTIAKHIQELTNAGMFRIEPVTPYPQTNDAVVEQAKKEIAAGHRPAIKGQIPNISSYDIIFVGSPIWWGTIAPPVSTFLTGNDLSGKTIIPFMTHEGSGMGNSVQDIKKLCPTSTVLEGLPIRGSSVGNAKEEIKNWLNKTGVIK